MTSHPRVEEAKGVPDVVFRRNPGHVEAVAAVALGHGELLDPVDQVCVVAVTPLRLDDEGPVFEGNEASAEEAAQANLLQQTFPWPSFPFSSYSSHFSFFFMTTEGSTADLLFGRYRITSNHCCKGQRHFGNAANERFDGECSLPLVCFFQCRKTVYSLSMVRWKSVFQIAHVH